MRWQSLGILSLFALLGSSHIASAQQPLDPHRAQTEVRMTRIENDMRRLTGQYEEAMHRLTQLNQQLEKQLEDMQYRIQTLERQLAEGAQGAAPASDDQATGAIAGYTPVPSDGPMPLPGMGGSSPAPQGRVADTLNDQLVSPGGTPAPPRGEPEETPERYLQGDTADAQFNYAFSLLRRDDFDGAELAFRAFLALNPDHRAAPNAKYWLGKTYFAQRNYTDAARVLLEGYEKFADSDKGPDMMVTLGLSLKELGQNDQACASFDELTRRYPNAPPAIKQKTRAGQQAAGCS